MKYSPRSGGSPRRIDSRAATVVLAVLALQGIIVYVIIAVAFPDWRPPFLGGASQEPAIPGRLTTAPPALSADPKVATSTDAAAGRMLFGGPGDAVLGNRVPEAPRRTIPTNQSGPTASLSQPPGKAETPSPLARMAFERYVDWLRSVELERQNLRNWGEQHLPAAVTPDTEATQQRRLLRPAGQEVSAFRQRVLRTKPVVPSDCRIVDQYYMGALAQEGAKTAAYLEALGQADTEPARRIERRGTAGIDRDLTVANAKLEQTFRKRGVPATLRLEMGPDASLLGVLTTQHRIR